VQQSRWTQKTNGRDNTGKTRGETPRSSSLLEATLAAKNAEHLNLKKLAA